MVERKILRAWYHTRFHNLLSALRRKSENFKPYFEGQRVIDLGSGVSLNNLATYLLDKLEAKEYVGVDPDADDSSAVICGKKASLRKSKALDFLLTQEDESSLVISTGAVPLFWDHFNGETAEEYYTRLAMEMYRVVLQGSIFVGDDLHKIGSPDKLIGKCLIDAGFEEAVGPVERNHDTDMFREFGWCYSSLFLYKK